MKTWTPNYPGSWKSPPSGRATAFTLVEILIVLAVVATLAAMLAPAAQQALQASMRVRCAQNMKTYHKALLEYAYDNNGKIVPCVDYEDKADPQENKLMIWENILIKGKYLPEGKVKNRVPDALRCPANPSGYMPAERSPKVGGNEQYKFGTPNYLYNMEAGSPVSFGGQPATPVLTLTAVLSGKLGALFEGGPYHNPYRCDYAASANAVYFDPTHRAYKIGDVHNEASHVMFWDGHLG